MARQFRSGELVRHSSGVTGEVVKGGFDPRVRWSLNGYIQRVNGDKLVGIGWHRHANYDGGCLFCGLSECEQRRLKGSADLPSTRI
jgi:hypothetical protein